MLAEKTSHVVQVEHKSAAQNTTIDNLRVFESLHSLILLQRGSPAARDQTQTQPPNARTSRTNGVTASLKSNAKQRKS